MDTAKCNAWSLKEDYLPRGPDSFLTATDCLQLLDATDNLLS